MQDNAIQAPPNYWLVPNPTREPLRPAPIPHTQGNTHRREGFRAYPLGVLRLDALEAEAEDGLAQLVAQAAADDGLAQAAVVQRLAQRRRACAAAFVSLTSRIQS